MNNKLSLEHQTNLANIFYDALKKIDDIQKENFKKGTGYNPKIDSILRESFDSAIQLSNSFLKSLTKEKV